MALILNIETATSVCSVALAKDEEPIAIRESFIRNSHAELLTLFIEDVMRESGMEIAQIDAVAVSQGPGSYTGLRIGVSTAKGLCYALDKPLIAIYTLQAMAAGASAQVAKSKDRENVLLYPMIDARRMEVYSALYNMTLREVREIRAEIITENSIAVYGEKYHVYYFGDGAAKCKSYFTGIPYVTIIENFTPSAGYMIPLANNIFMKKKFENIAYFEPFYLKDFIAGKPRVKGLQ